VRRPAAHSARGRGSAAVRENAGHPRFWRQASRPEAWARQVGVHEVVALVQQRLAEHASFFGGLRWQRRPSDLLQPRRQFLDLVGVLTRHVPRLADVTGQVVELRLGVVSQLDAGPLPGVLAMGL
jgi:hypothetical protein